MDTPDFLKVLQHFCGTTSEDAENVLNLKDAFPFSQVLHTLSARVSKDHKFSNSQQALQLAAVYAADRNVLRDIMERQTSFTFLSGKKSETITEISISDDFSENLIHELERLHKLRENFELLFADGAATSFQSPSIVETPQEFPIEEKVLSDEHQKSKKERIVELARAVSVGETALEAPRTRRKRKDAVDILIDQIATTKEEISPENEKQKEQIQMIDQFIRVQPTISGTKDKQALPEDLSTIKSGEFGESIISETLVEILLKQGKKDKAVEVLKKLIWKFPQKKAYFATQIEELRK